MDKESLLERSKALKADVENSKEPLVNESAVNICNTLIEEAKKLLGDKIKDLEPVNMQLYSGTKQAKKQEFSVKIGQIIALLECDDEDLDVIN